MRKSSAATLALTFLSGACSLIPQLDSITRTQLAIREGRAFASGEPGLGIDWDWDAIGRLRKTQPVVAD